MDRTEEVIREMDKLANEDHTNLATDEENYRLSEQLVDTFEFSWFRHDASKASSRFETSLNFSTVQEPGGYSLLPKLAKLFLILVELARFLVASLI